MPVPAGAADIETKPVATDRPPWRRAARETGWFPAGDALEAAGRRIL